MKAHGADLGGIKAHASAAGSLTGEADLTRAFEHLMHACREVGPRAKQIAVP